MLACLLTSLLPCALASILVLAYSLTYLLAIRQLDRDSLGGYNTDSDHYKAGGQLGGA